MFEQQDTTRKNSGLIFYLKETKQKLYIFVFVEKSGLFLPSDANRMWARFLNEFAITELYVF